MDDDKVYTQEVVPAKPFPGEVIPVTTTTQSSSGGNFTPTVSSDKPLPVKKIATELLSTALNTRTRNILQEFELQQSGGFRVGNFEEGLSGDIRITPNGITARDIAGITTFAIDGTTGDAIFKGQLRSGTLITGEITLGDGSIILDDMGLKSTTNFLKSTTSHGTTETFTTTSYVDLTGQSQSFSLLRPTLIFISVTLHMYLTESVGNTGDASVAIDIDGVVDNQGLAVIRSGNNYGHTYSLVYPVILNQGNHIVKLKARFDGITAGAPVLNVLESYMTRIHLGS